MRKLISAILLCSAVIGPATANEEATPEQINEMCFYLGTIMGEVISEQRSLGADVATSAAFAANQYAKRTMPPGHEGDPTPADALPYVNVANAYTDEIYKLEPRKPETMGLYLYFVCQTNAMMGRDTPSDQESLDKINALLERCEAENTAQQGMIQCIGVGMGPLIDRFPVRK